MTVESEVAGVAIVADGGAFADCAPLRRSRIGNRGRCIGVGTVCAAEYIGSASASPKRVRENPAAGHPAPPH